MARQRKTCVIFVKLPEPGKVKTRLAKGSNKRFALAFYKTCSERIIRELCNPSEWNCTIAFSPAQEERAVQEWLSPSSQELNFEAQLDDADLGNRMGHSIRQALSQGTEKVLLVGSDIPDLGKEVLRQAFSALDKAEVVLGPAKDGGFYLVGARTLPAAIFKDVEWSTERVLASTLGNCERAGVPCDHKSLPVLQDIDTIQDLESWVTQGQANDLKKSVQGLIDKQLGDNRNSSRCN